MAGTTISSGYTSQVAVDSSENTVTVTGTIITSSGNGLYDGASDPSLVIIENYGIIIGDGIPHSGIRLRSGGILTNAATGTIGGYGGADFGFVYGSRVVNAGSIYATGLGPHQFVLSFEGGGVVTNLSTGTISGANGISVLFNPGTVVNAGVISASNVAVAFRNGFNNLVVFDPGATFTGLVNGANNQTSGGVSTLELASGASTGTLTGLGSQFVGFTNVTVDSGASWVVSGSDTLQAGAAWSGGITLAPASYFVVGTGGTVVGSGTAAVLGPATGGATVINAGLIDPGTYGVYLPSGGSVTNAASSTIYGTVAGVKIAGGAGTVLTAGSIGGGTDAVSLASGYANRVIVDPGASFTGAVDGGNTIGATVVSTLELASGTSAGTLDGLGVQFVNFASIAVDAGAQWTLTSDALGSGYAITDNGTLTNAGSLGSGIALGNHGLLINLGGATIAGSPTAIYDAIYGNAGTIINQSGALVEGYHHGLSLTAGTLVNAGSISATMTYGSAGVYLRHAALTNQSTGTISGVSFGVFDSDGSLVNAGLIADTGTTAFHTAAAVYLAAGDLTNQAGGTIVGQVAGVMAGYSVGNNTVLNDGTITAGTFGVDLITGGAVTNFADGVIESSGSFAVGISGGAGTLENAGSIRGLVTFASGVTNRLVIDPGAYFSTTVNGGNTIPSLFVSTLELASGATGGTISGLGSQFINFASIVVDPGAAWTLVSETLPASYSIYDDGTLTNTGSLGSTVKLGTGGVLTNAAGGAIYVTGGNAVRAYGVASIDNAGYIGDSNIAINLNTDGSITNESGGTISGAYGVYANGQVTVVNAGSIAGTTDAVFFAPGNNDWLIVEPGAAFTGTVNGGNKIGAIVVTTLELASGASIGTLTGLGTQFINFANVTVDSGAGWVLSGSDTLQAGATWTGGITLAPDTYFAIGTGGTIVGSGTAAVLGGAGATVVNAGVIDPAIYGVYLPSGGSVINVASGTIYGTIAGVKIAGGAATVDNAGTIAGGTDAVLLASGFANTVTVEPGAVFHGIVDGGNTIGNTAISTLELVSGASAGTLSGLGSEYIDFAQVTIDSGAQWLLDGSNSLSNGAALTISGTATAGGTFFNAGTISGYQLYLSGATLTNESSGQINDAIIGVGAGGADAVVNQGTIDELNTSAVSIYLGGAGSVTNAAGALLSGGYGVKIHDANATLVNLGRLIATGNGPAAFGAYLRNGGLVMNGQAGAGTSTAEIQGYYGVTFRLSTGNYGTLYNFGTILATATAGAADGAALLQGGDVFSGQSGATAALIQGTRSGVYDSSGTVTNYATIVGTNTAAPGYGVQIEFTGIVSNLDTASLIEGYVGVQIGLDGTVINAGTIASNQGTSGTAVSLTGGTGRVIDDPTGQFIGGIFGGTGGTATFELASGSSAGTISGFGSNIINFTSIVVDPGANWTLASTLTAPGYTITDAGTLTNVGTLDAAITLLSGAVLTNAAGALISTYSVYGAGAASIVNAGSIYGPSYAIELSAAGSVTNLASGVISGNDGVYGNAALTVVNAGTISAATTGIVAQDGGNVTNEAGGLITAGTFAIAGASGTPLTVNNAGSIYGAGTGIQLANGFLTNQSGGTISGNDGVYLGPAATAVNAGVVDAVAIGVNINAGTLINQAGGTIYSSTDGVFAYGGPVTLTNAGSIYGRTDAVLFSSGHNNQLIVDPSANFSGTIDGGNAPGSSFVSTLELASGASAGTLNGLSSPFVNFAQITVDTGAYWSLYYQVIYGGDTLTNSGTISSGVTLSDGAFLTNTSGGLIINTCGCDAVYALDGTVTVINAGSIDGGGLSFGVNIYGGLVSNQAGGTISGHRGVGAFAAGTVVNGGLIVGGAAGGDGVDIRASGLTNLATGTITAAYGVYAYQSSIFNAGSIYGSVYGVALDDGGIITNAAGATISGGIGIDICSCYGATIINAGAITGSTDAVYFVPGYTYGDRLIIDPGAVFSGTVDGGNPVGYTAVSALELASGTSTGTLTGLGSHYINFAQITVDAGATWKLVSDAIGSGYKIYDNGTLTNTGSLGSPVTLSSAVLTNAAGATIASNGIGVAGNGTVVNAGTIEGALTAVGLDYGFNNRLVIDPLAVFVGAVDGGNPVSTSSYSILELASGTSAGTLSGLGSQFYNFAHITIDAGATWTLTSDTIGSGYLIKDNGTLTNTGSLGSGVYLGNGAALTNAAGATISGYNAVSASGTAHILNAGAIHGAHEGVYVANGAVTNAAGGTITSGNLGVELYGSGSLVNDGGISATSTGVYLANGGSITNTGGSIYGDGYGVASQNNPATVVNSGSIGGNVPIELRAGGSVTNLTGGTIEGNGGVIIAAGNGDVQNAGLIRANATSGIGVFLQSGGNVTNQAGGTIYGGQTGVELNSYGTVFNAGSISGSSAIGLYLGDGAIVTNASGATITGGYAGIKLHDLGTVENAGSIGGGSYAVLFYSVNANRLIIDPGATFSGKVDGGNGTYISTLELASGTSAGTLTGLGSHYINFAQITVDAGATWTLASDTIGTGYTIYDSGTLTNQGSLGSTVTLAGGAVLTNAASGTIAVSSGYAVRGTGLGATIQNAGVITGANGVRDAKGGMVANSGTITGTLYDGVTQILLSSLTNSASGSIYGAIAGVYAYGTDITVENAGSIAGGTFAVRFAAGNDGDRLIVDPRATFSGKVDGGNTASASHYTALELVSGTSAGTLTGLGSHYVNFAHITIDAGATWTLVSDGIGAGYSIYDNGTLTNTGSLGSGVTVLGDGVLKNENGAIINSGSQGILGYDRRPITISNYGSIYGATSGVDLTNGGTIYNAAGATIHGNTYGVLITSTSYAMVSNYGVISADSGFAALPGYVTLNNAGTIIGAGGAPVYFAGQYNRLILDAGEVLAAATAAGGGTYGDVLELQSGTAASGTLVGLGSSFVGFGTLVVDVGANWTLASDTVRYGYFLYDFGTLTNQGSIGSTFTVGTTGTLVNASGATIGDGGANFGVLQIGSSYIGNRSGATIAGYYAGISSPTTAATTIVNDGLITGLATRLPAVGVYLLNGTIDNQSSGTIVGSNVGVYTAYYDPARVTLVNAGSIYGRMAGAALFGGGAVTNVASASIGGGQFGIYMRGGATLSNAGSIFSHGVRRGSAAVVLVGGGEVTNAVGGSISGNRLGLYIESGTLLNAGSITGGTVAVQFGTYSNDRLILDPGASFTGIVDGGNTIGSTYVSTLELAGGASNGTLTGLGTKYIDFADVVIDPGAHWVLSGANTVISGVTVSGGITVGSSAYLFIADGATVVGSTAIFGGDPPTVVNAGAVFGNSGIYLQSGGNVTNESSGTISGTSGNGIQVAVAAGTIDNAGSIYASGVGVYLKSGGSVTNRSGGVISAGHTIYNPGSGVSGTGTGVYLLDGGSVTNLAGGLISAGDIGIVVSTAAGTIDNAGNVSALSRAIYLRGGGSVTNESSGTISGSGGSGIKIAGAATIDNTGSIYGAVTAVYLKDGGSVTNQAGGAISSGINGILLSNAAGTIDNAGTIGGSEGVFLFNGGDVTNQASGAINASYRGIDVRAASTIENAGSISARSDDAIYLGGGGSVINVNGATISANRFGITASNLPVIVVNDGYVSAHARGIVLNSGGTVVNQSGGTITGGTFAIQFAFGTGNRVVAYPGASFIGGVNGGSGTLELASAISAGTLTGLGLHSGFYSFTGVTIDSGATWTLASDSFAPGYPANQVFDAGTLTNLGSLGPVVTLAAYAVLTNAAGATISSGVRGAYGATGNTVVNLGLISELSGAGIPTGVLLRSGSITNASGGTIVGEGYGVGVLDGAGSVVNAGSISSTNFIGVDLNKGGSLTNDSGGTIYGSDYGVRVRNAAGTVVNAGTISSGTVSTAQAIAFQGGYPNRLIVDPGASFVGGVYGGGGTLELASGVSAGTLTGLGSQFTHFHSVTIDSGATWTFVSDVVGSNTYVSDFGTLFNTGSIFSIVDLHDGGVLINAASGTIHGANTGIYASGAYITVENTGSIGGGTYAVQFAPDYNGDRLIIDPGATFGGTVDGGNTVSSYNSNNYYSSLELASGASAGTLTGLGGKYINFADITIDASASWTLASASLRSSNYYIKDRGTLTNATSLGSGVYLAGTSALLINPVGSTINAANDGVSGRFGGTVVNAGLIEGTGTYGAGVQLARGGITNQSSGTISGYYNGVDIGFGASLVNSGLVLATGTSSTGVDAFKGSIITNAASGTITGQSYGVHVAFAGTVLNAGSIYGGTDAVYFYRGHAGDLLIVDPGATFSGTVDGGNTIGSTYVTTLELASGTAAGTLIGLGSRYINFASIMVDSGATWTLTSDTVGSGTNVDDFGTLTNRGTIRSTVHVGTHAVLTNASTGTISSSTAVYADASAVTVANAGYISGSAVSAIYFGFGGNVTNASSGTIYGSSDYAIRVNAAAGTVVNAGYIYGRSFGIGLQGGGSLVNQFGGTIRGGSYGVALAHSESILNAGFVAGNFGVVLGSGDNLTNASGATISGRGDGVRFNGGGTLTNASGGTIVGGNYGAYAVYGAVTIINAGYMHGGVDAAKFYSGSASRLIVDPGASFNGSVLGGGAALELASGASAGTLSGLGTQFTGFARTAIDAGASWNLSGTLDAGSTLTNDGTLSVTNASLTDSGTLVNNGAIVLDPSTLTADDLTGNGGVTIDAGSTLDALGTVGSGQTISFSGGGYLHLYQPTSATGGVVNFALGDTIDLKGIAPASVSYASGTLSFDGGAFPLDILPGNTLVTSASADGSELTALCFVAGTMILTPSGERRVQELAVGDLVTTASGQARPIAWIGAGKVLATRGRRNAATPVIVRKGAIAPNVPSRDLHVTKGHCLYIDEVLIPVEFLVNHRSIMWDDRAQEVELYHLELDTHDVLIANRAPAESYRDDGNRWLFRNANARWDLPQQEPCAPILTGGPVVDAAWRRLLHRAGPRPGLPLTADADLHLVVDGKRVKAASRVGDIVTFRLSQRPESVRIVSRAAAQDQLGVARDPRELGVALRQIVLRRGRKLVLIESEDARLADGFYPLEVGDRIRWTNGDAALPAELFGSFDGPVQIELTIAHTTHYVEVGEAA